MFVCVFLANIKTGKNRHFITGWIIIGWSILSRHHFNVLLECRNCALQDSLLVQFDLPELSCSAICILLQPTYIVIC